MRRFSIAGMMALVLICGVGFAALRNSNPFWASATFTLALVGVLVAIVGAFAGKGRARPAWAGYAVFGSAYFLVDLLPARPFGSLGAGPVPWPSLLFEWGIAALQPSVHPWGAGSSEWVQYDQVGHSLGMIVFALLGAIIGRLLGPGAVEDRGG